MQGIDGGQFGGEAWGGDCRGGERFACRVEVQGKESECFLHFNTVNFMMFLIPVRRSWM